jgi:hypothetical protein
MKKIFVTAIAAGVLSTVTGFGAGPDFQSKYYAVGFDPAAPAFSFFSLDSLGHGNTARNPVLVPTNSAAQKGWAFAPRSARSRYTYQPDSFTYQIQGQTSWQITCADEFLILRSDFHAGEPSLPFVLCFDQKQNHATLLGRLADTGLQMKLPCLLHLPDMGTLRVTSSAKTATLDYDARRLHDGRRFVSIEFPPATAVQPVVEYRLQTALVYPPVENLENNPLFDGFRRDFLNIFQVNPRLRMLANNASSDAVTFTVYTYAEMARHLPPLADGLTANDLVRWTLDEYLNGAKGYGQKGYGAGLTNADVIPWTTPWTSADALPSLVIAACVYADSANALEWARNNYDKISTWAREIMATDKSGEGLIEYPGTGNFGDRPLREKRPSNWWDTINFGHEDAYANALAYHALQELAALAEKLGRVKDANEFNAFANKLRDNYAKTFYNPATGILAGWKSADGQLHDYWFTFVQGAAITYGLVDDKLANSIMDKMLAKMQEVGYTNFALGLPGNLIPIRKGDYVFHNSPPTQYGEPKLDDGSDGFQYYENGGATGCWSYFTVKALYKLGRAADARKIFHPMLEGYARGEFQGFGENGMSRDWRDWSGGCHGYEGLLVDNYFSLLAVLDDLKAKP